MNVFETHGRIIDDYARYIGSFINISDDEIAGEVDRSLAEGRLWPQPLLQFNPAYEMAGSIDQVVQDGLMHSDVRHIFKGYHLYKHQREAIGLGVTPKDFIVTSGTGSGKSLTYIGSIFNHLLNNPQAEGVAAVIVYPMNALINSQTNEFNTYKENFERKRFFHWFLEFPHVMERGGFDCILRNPPYLGGQSLSGTYGHAFCETMKWLYAPTGLSELVVYFLRRIYGLLRDGGFTSIITTNSIVDGDVRKDGLEQLVTSGAEINMAVRGMKWPGTANLVVSLLAVHKGTWDGMKVLDGQPVDLINAFFEAAEDLGEPEPCRENDGTMYMGTIYLGDGFVLNSLQHSELSASGASNSAMPRILNGKEVNSSPVQQPERHLIFLEGCEEVHEAEIREPAAVEHLRRHVLPSRLAQKNERAKVRWWRYYRYNEECYAQLASLSRCFVAARTTKHLSFSAMPTDYIFSDALYVFTTDRWDLFTVVLSTLHEVWSRKYSGSLETRLRYSPSDCFGTFAFPTGLWHTADPVLADIGERYHWHRKALMETLWLGLTKIYNLFHAADLTPEMVAKVSKKDVDTASAGYASFLDLRSLHVEMDLAVRKAYGWQDLDLEHGFYEVETLPENDRVRYTVSPAARREVLKRLLAENHARVQQETENTDTKPKPKQGSAKHGSKTRGPSLFPEGK